MEYFRPITVTWGECDPFGLVYFPHMLMWFNDAEHEFFANAGYPVNRMIEGGTAFVMGRVQFEFTGPAAYGDTLITRIAVAGLTGSTLTWDCSARQADGDAPVIQGTATRVHAQIQPDRSLRATRIPDHLRRLLGEEQGKPAAAVTISPEF